MEERKTETEKGREAELLKNWQENSGRKIIPSYLPAPIFLPKSCPPIHQENDKMKKTSPLNHVFILMAALVLTAATPVIAQEKTTESSSTTVGLAAPSNAIVLFDGSDVDAWKPLSFLMINPKDNQKEIQWKIVDDKSLQVTFEFEGKKRKQFLCTKQRFGDYRLHLEFQLPEDGGKGNSGIFFGPFYELQILDSAKKDKAGLSDCGAIYQIRAPDENAALSPGEWQSVDLEYKAARFNLQGNMTESGAARVTIRLNGKLIHDDFKLSVRRNKYATFKEEPLSPIVLQDHGSPVKFRNIWIVEGDAKSWIEKMIQ